MTSDANDGRFAPPQARVDDVEPAARGLQLATRGNRLAAAIVDVLIGAGLLWLVSKLTPFNPWFDAAEGMWSLHVKGPLAGLCLYLLVHGWLLVTRGQTVGKALLKIRIVRTDGAKVSPARLGLRYGIGWLVSVVPAVGQAWGLVDALLIFRASRQCLHDLIADTIVVRA